jgi:hypothetical protein
LAVCILCGVFMVKNKPKTVDEIFSKVEGEYRDIAQRFRFLVNSTLPKADELVKRGRLTYKFGGKDFAAIRIAKSHVDLLFFQGTRMSSSLLKGTGNEGDHRHVEIINLKELNSSEPEIIRLLKEAATIATVI